MRAVLTIISSIIFLIVSLIFAYSYSMTVYKSSGQRADDKMIVITKGMGLNMIARKLENEGLIPHRYVFMIAARLKGYENDLKAGEYMIERDQSIDEILREIAFGEIYIRQYTIPEGRTSYEIVELLNNIENLTGQITNLPAEGSLLPETYRYEYHDDRGVQINNMQKAMNDILTQAWDLRQDGLPLKSKEEALILASIVEKETGIDGERAKVAGVFLNRLKIGMPLQSDPTVIYAITKGKESLGRPLYRSDWKIESPYNTYRIAALPPTPICNPGRESIEAVLNPSDHNYYYFVANGTGGHSFATTLTEHNRNVTEWRKIRDGK